MNPTLASLLTLMLIALLLVPLAITALRPAWTKPAASYCAALVLAVALWQTGWLSGRTVPAAAAQMKMSAGSAEQCQRMIALLERSRVILSRANPSRPEVNQRLWESLPPMVREAGSACLERERSPNAVEQPFELVLRPAA